MIDFDSLPILSDFSDLKFGDKVYSKKFGLGKVLRFFNEEIVVQFAHRRTRIAPDNHDLVLVAKRSRKTGRNKVEGFIDGAKVSFTKLIRKMKEGNSKDFVPLNTAINILGLKKDKVVKFCESNGIEITNFGIKKQDFVKLNNLTRNMK